MKFKELKNRLKDRFLITASAGVLAFSLIVTGVTCSVYAAKGDATPVNAQTIDLKNKTEDAIVNSIFGGTTEVAEKEIGKEETVYVITNANGKVETTIVSDHLVNKDGSATLSDKSNLSDIKNVKGDESFTQNGDSLTWEADGNDIYYQGTTNAELPITQEVVYYLDGKEISADDLAGKSGKVTIRVNYTNNTSVKQTVNGKDYTVCVPFAAVSAFALNENFTNVEVVNGKLMETSAGQVVVGYALPGLTESLNIDTKELSEIDIPEYFEITADVEDFKLDVAMTLVANAGSTVSATGFSLDNISGVVDTLASATQQLQDGSTELSDGMDTLYTGLKAYTDGVKQLDDGINVLYSKSGELVTGVDKLNEGAQQLYGGLTQLKAGAHQLDDGVNELVTTLAGMPASVKAGINETLNELNTSGFATAVYAAGYNKDAAGKITVDNIVAVTTFVAGHEAEIVNIMKLSGVAAAANMSVTDVAAILADPGHPAYATITSAYASADATAKTKYQEALAGCYQGLGAATVYTKVEQNLAAKNGDITMLKNGADQLAAGLDAAEAGAKELAAGTKTLVDTMPTLTTGIKQLKTGADTLASKNAELLDGATKLNDGSTQLAEGLTTLNEDGVKKIIDMYNGDVTDLVNRLQAVLEAGENYGAFTDSAEGVNASTKFIYKLAPIGE